MDFFSFVVTIGHWLPPPPPPSGCQACQIRVSVRFFDDPQLPIIKATNKFDVRKKTLLRTRMTTKVKHKHTHTHEYI